MHYVSTTKVQKWFLVLLTLFAFPATEAFTQVVTLESPRAFDFLSNSGSGPDEIAARPTDLTGDIQSDIDQVRVQVIRTSDVKYWDGFEFVDQPTFVRAMVFADMWILPSVDFSVPSDYFVRLAAVSTSGDFFSPSSNGIYFAESVIDSTPPTGELILPSPLVNRRISINRFTSRSVVTDLGGVVTGRKEAHLFFRTFDEFGVKSLTVQVIHKASGEFWNGSDWQTAPAAVATGDGRSGRTNNRVNFDRLGTYLVRMRIEDNSGNISTGAENDRYELLVVEDLQAPTVRLNLPRAEFTVLSNGERIGSNPNFGFPERGVHNVRGAASDGSQFDHPAGPGVGVADVRVQVERVGNVPRYWNGTSFQTTPAWNVATLSFFGFDALWDIGDVDFSISGRYLIRLSVTDNAGNRSPASENPLSFILIE